MTDLVRDTQEIKALLVAQIERLAMELAPDGRRSGAYWMARNPTRDDRTPGSFWIMVKGPAAGAWREEATGDKGDVFGLVAYVTGQPDFQSTIAWCRQWLRLPEMTPGERQRRVAKARAAVVTDAAEKDDADRRRAKAMFIEACKRPWPLSPADLYLKGRGIDVSLLGRRPGVLGWLPASRHQESGRTVPVMVAAMIGADGQVQAVHRTFIEQVDGVWRKARVDPPRKIWPRFAGAAIRVWRGESRLSVADAAKAGLREALVLTEGVEDALSVALAVPELRVWAVGSLGNVGRQRLPACVDRVIVCADNDWGKPQAQRALGAALEALARQGVDVEIARAHVGKDVNDQLRGMAA